MVMKNRYYAGVDSIANFLQPNVKEYIPLVELPPALNPYLETHDIHLDIKLMNTLPLANVKSLPAWNMLNEAQTSLFDQHIVESSSGNTVFSLGLLAKHFGAQNVTAIASNDVSAGKLNLLRLAGINVTLMDGPMCPDANDPNSTIAVARRQGKDEGWYNPSQYDNEANPGAHEKITGPQLYDQLGDDLGMLVAGLGTTGTLLGTARYLHTKITDLKVAGVVRVPNNPVPGVRTYNGLREVGLEWDSVITESPVVINEHDSYAYSLQLIREGLLVGPSAGFAYAGALRQLQLMEESNEIEALRGRHVVFIAPDSMFPYVDDYFEVLGDSYFPIINDQSSGVPYREAAQELAGVAELTAEEVLADYDCLDETVMQPRHYSIVDVRTPREFADHHLPASINVPISEIFSWIKDATTEKPIVFVCGRGSMSLRAAHQASQAGVVSYSMIGGTVVWSDHDYPRIKAPFC
jgi:cysteine synthase/rhodanese-related sulfurtransferase